MSTTTALMMVWWLVPAQAPPAGHPPVAAHPEAEAPAPGEFLDDLDAARDVARSEGRPVFVHFTASWCAPCKEMRSNTYPAKPVAARLERFVRVEVDTESDKGRQAWLEFKLSGLPVATFLRPTGEEARELRIEGLKEPAEMAKLLDGAIQKLSVPAPPGRERAAASSGEAATAGGEGGGGKPAEPTVRGGEWQTRDTSWVMTALGIGVGVLALGLGLLIAIKARRGKR